MSTQVDFYILPDIDLSARLPFACKLLDIAWQRQHRVYVYCDSSQMTHHMDELLWTFKEDSFIPHGLLSEPLTPPPPIQIGCEPPPTHQRDILLNLTQQLPAFYANFARVIEMIVNQDEIKTKGRELFRTYREQGCAMKTYDLGNKP